MGRIKLIGLDLDGTLLTSKKELLPYTKDVLRRAADAGVQILAATGRPYTGIPKDLREFPGIRYALTSNGARVLDSKTGEILIQQLLSLDSARRALKVLAKYDTMPEVYFDGQGYVEEGKMAKLARYHHDPNMWPYVRSTRKQVPDLEELIRREHRDMDKVQALFADMDERKEAWARLSEFDDLELVGSLSYNIEINQAGVNKGTALVELGRMLGIKREEIMACGDGDNDVKLLEEVGLGVAMANAQEQVKAAADYITESNDEEGAAKAIEKFVLQGGEGC